MTGRTVRIGVASSVKLKAKTGAALYWLPHRRAGGLVDEIGIAC